MSINWTYKLSDNLLEIYKNNVIYANTYYTTRDDLLFFLAMVINNVLVENENNDVVNIMDMINIIMNIKQTNKLN